MIISILNPGGNVEYSNVIDTKTLYNLSIDRIFKYICPNTEKREYFLRVISELNYDEKAVAFRSETLKDFLNSDGLFDELNSVYSRFEELRISLKSSLKTDTRMDFSYNSSVTTKKNELRAYSLAFKRSLCFVRGIGEILSKYSIKSKALNRLLKECRSIYENDSFEGLLSLCSKYEFLSERGILDFKYTLTDNMRIDSFEFIDHRHIRISDPDNKGKRGLFFKKKNDDKYICEIVASSDNRAFNSLISGAFTDMAALFKSLTTQIFKKILGVKSELDFYYVAIRYVKTITEKNIPFTFPIISSEGNIRIDGLFDPLLVMQKDDATSVVPNSYDISNELKGLIIYGKNGSGKTVYMRAFGVMQILAQAGLPVTCRYAETRLYSQIVSQYAESENNQVKENDLGRFEAEVKELSRIIDTVKRNSLILLNETFQSTAYKEGSVGLWNILKYFIECDNTVFLVSHLHDLKEMIDHSKFDILQSGDNYVVSSARATVNTKS